MYVNNHSDALSNAGADLNFFWAIIEALTNLQWIQWIRIKVYYILLRTSFYTIICYDKKDITS